jgi:hypothetical protein
MIWSFHYNQAYDDRQRDSSWNNDVFQPFDTADYPILIKEFGSL